MASLDDLKCDLAEVEKLTDLASRQRVKGVLNIEAHKLRSNISQILEDQKSKSPGTQADTGEKKKQSTASKRYTKTITNYAWDQSEKFMKIYVTMDGVQSISKENVTCEFTDSSFRLRANDLSGADHMCHVGNLFADIIPDKSYHKVKTDCVLVMLKKQEERTWAYVTQQEAKSKDKKPKPDIAEKDADPQANLMKMMQQMYEEGDDEMKRTIAKSMYESKNKNMMAPDEMPPM